MRETGDAGYYNRAHGVLRRALELSPENGLGADRAWARSRSRATTSPPACATPAGVTRWRPRSSSPTASLVDALVELGRYGEAGAALQRMVDLKPDLSSYARVSYFRELHGDLPGAIAAMRLAVSAGGDAPENVAYVQTLLGNLEFELGRLGAAREAYRTALARYAGYVPAEAGLARVEAAHGRFGPAIARLPRAVARLPLPEYVVAPRRDRAGRRPARRRAGATSRSWAPRSSCCAPRASTSTSTSRCSRPTTAAPRAPSRSPGAPGGARRACAPPTRSAGR